MATETELYHAWRLLDGVARGQAGNLEQRTDYVAPAQAILETSLNEMGFSIVNGILIPVGEAPQEPVRMLPPPDEWNRPGQDLPPHEIDNTLPPEGTGDPEARAADWTSHLTPMEAEQQSAEHHERRRRR